MEFVTFEIAKKLKEKGYPQHITNEAYITDNYGENEIEIQLGYDIGDRLPITLIPDYMDDVAAPTISQVLKWLREEKNIYLEIVIVLSAEYMCDIYKINTRPLECLGSTEYFKTYEQAALAGIEYVLNNLI